MTDQAEKTPKQWIEALWEDFENALAQVENEDQIYHRVEVPFLGKKGSFPRQKQLLMASASPDERKTIGQLFNEYSDKIYGAIAARRRQFVALARERELSRRVDLSFRPSPSSSGSIHPITATRRALERVFHRLGFDVLDGPHVEAEDYNFDKLNIAAGHPARDMQDTFFVLPRGVEEAVGSPIDSSDPTASFVLRTHTSPVQVRTMLSHRPPIKIVAPGTVFRYDDDATHSPMFNQIEGLYVDRGVTMADLKATLYNFVAAFFGAGLQVRFRPSFFPFVEPGAEFDVQCPFCREPGEGMQASRGCGLCKHSGWIELGGSGMVHPAVFEQCGIDPEIYTGWAFGFGIDRMAMLRYGVPHLKLFFEGDLRFLEQFPC